MPGPVGVQILPGSFAPGGSDVTPASLDRLLAGLNRAGSVADLVVLDLGAVTGSCATRLWRAADLVLLVTTTEPGAVMDAYAAVKLLEKRGRDSLTPSRASTDGELRAGPAKDARPLFSPGQRSAVATVVSWPDDRAVAADVHGRLASACRRFLGIEVRAAPPIHVRCETDLVDDRPVAQQIDPALSTESYDVLAHFVASWVGLAVSNPAAAYTAAG